MTGDLVTLRVAAERMSDKGITVRQLRARIATGRLLQVRPQGTRAYLVSMADVRRLYAPVVRAQPEPVPHETELQRIARQLAKAGIGGEPSVPIVALSGDTPNTPRARAFTDAAAVLVTGKPWGPCAPPRTEEQRTALHVCMNIAAMFGKDGPLSKRERLLLRRLGRALSGQGKAERDLAKALAVNLVEEAQEKFRRVIRRAGRDLPPIPGGAMAQVARQLVGDLQRQCATGFEKLLDRVGLELVQRLLGDEPDSAKIVMKLGLRVGWFGVASARSPKEERVLDSVRKAVKRYRD